MKFSIQILYRQIRQPYLLSFATAYAVAKKYFFSVKKDNIASMVTTIPDLKGREYFKGVLFHAYRDPQVF